MKRCNKFQEFKEKNKNIYKSFDEILKAFVDSYENKNQEESVELPINNNYNNDNDINNNNIHKNINENILRKKKVILILIHMKIKIIKILKKILPYHFQIFKLKILSIYHFLFHIFLFEINI